MRSLLGLRLTSPESLFNLESSFISGFNLVGRVQGVVTVSKPARCVTTSDARPIPRVAARQADARRRILEAARMVVAEQGFTAAQVAVIASVAGVATGSIYRHFPSKASLFSEMLRAVCLRGLEVARAIARQERRTAIERIGDAVATFVERALRGEGLAYAVIVEPMDPEVDQVRLEARAGLADAFAA